MSAKGITFGQRVRELRKAKNLSQRELADRAAKSLKPEERGGFDFTYLSKMENEKTPPPSIAVITQLAHALDADVEELIVLAGKVPSNLGETLKESEGARAFYRSAMRADLTEDDWEKLLKQLEKRTKARENLQKSED